MQVGQDGPVMDPQWKQVHECYLDMSPSPARGESPQMLVSSNTADTPSTINTTVFQASEVKSSAVTSLNNLAWGS